MAYNGSLLWVATTATDRTVYAGTDRLKTINSTVYLSFPMHVLDVEGYTVQPNIREEIKAYRDENTRNLTRITASGKKTQIVMKTRKNLPDADKVDVLKWFTDHESDAGQRKISVLYFDIDSSTYKTGNFYRANPEYTISKIEGTKLFWNAFNIEMVEY